MNFNFSMTGLSAKKLTSLFLALILVLGTGALILSQLPAIASYAGGDVSGDVSGDASGDAALDPEVSSLNYTLKIKNINGLNYIRLAKGNFTTSKQIKEAEVMVPFDKATIDSYTVGGVFMYDLPDGGEYSMWLRYDDGRAFIINHTAENFQPTYTVKGLNFTFYNLYGVKDIFIASGRHYTYRNVSDNSIVRLTANKFGGKHNYAYPAPMPGAGVYTVLIRLENGNNYFSFAYCDAKTPVITFDGIKMNIGNLDNVKVIRVAPGQWSTSHDVKAATGNRNFTASEIAKTISADGVFTVTNSKDADGMVYTVCVEYYDGYSTILNFTVETKKPVYTFTEDSATFTSLDDLYIIRYAKGNYTTANEVKKGLNNKYVKHAAVTDDTVIIENLVGEYTFLVQYNDGSVNIIHHTF